MCEIESPLPATAEATQSQPSKICADEWAASLCPKITIDSNEAAADYVAYLKTDDLFEVSQKRLEVGDILIEDLIN